MALARGVAVSQVMAGTPVLAGFRLRPQERVRPQEHAGIGSVPPTPTGMPTTIEAMVRSHGLVAHLGPEPAVVGGLHSVRTGMQTDLRFTTDRLVMAMPQPEPKPG